MKNNYESAKTQAFCGGGRIALNILDICEDPTDSPVSCRNLKFPSNTSYPAGVVCAKDTTNPTEEKLGKPMMGK